MIKKCFQFTATEAINDKENPEKTTKIKPSISEYKEYTKQGYWNIFLPEKYFCFWVLKHFQIKTIGYSGQNI